MRTPFPCVPAAFQQWEWRSHAFSLEMTLPWPVANYTAWWERHMRMCACPNDSSVPVSKCLHGNCLRQTEPAKLQPTASELETGHRTWPPSHHRQVWRLASQKSTTTIIIVQTRTLCSWAYKDTQTTGRTRSRILYQEERLLATNDTGDSQADDEGEATSNAAVSDDPVPGSGITPDPGSFPTVSHLGRVARTLS